MPEPGTELTPTITAVLDRTTGELISVAEAETEQLAQYVTNQQQLRDELRDAEAVVSGELVARMDQSASWTMRVGDPKTGVQWEITTSSPTAGTETYPVDLLQAALADLIAKGTITPDAASKACKRHLVLTIDAPWDADLAEMEQVAGGVTFQLAGHDVSVVKAESSVKAVASGINALRKVPGTQDALDEALVPQPAGNRRAKVTIKGRES